MVSPDPPVPTGATLSVGTSDLTVTFDRALNPGVSLKGNWTGIGLFGVGRRDIGWAANLTIAGNTVTGIASAGIVPEAPPDVIHYAATPADIVSTKGIPAAAFTDFPLTSIP